jgi:hypothetical protein
MNMCTPEAGIHQLAIFHSARLRSNATRAAISAIAALKNKEQVTVPRSPNQLVARLLLLLLLLMQLEVVAAAHNWQQ